MVRYDPFGKTEGMRRQVNDLILTAYSKGYNDGEHDEQDRKLEMLLKEKKGQWEEKQDNDWAGGGAWVCSECGCGYAFGAYHEADEFNYCPNCGARMEE